MPLTRLDTFLIRLLYAMAALIVVFQVLNRDAVVSLLFYASFVVVLALWLSAAFRKMALLDALVLTTIALALIHVLINAIATDASLSFQYLKKYIIFAFTLLMFSAADKLRVDADTGRWISRVMALSSAVLVAMYFWKGRELYEIHGRISNYLTFHFTNPNLTGLFLFCLAVYQFADALYGRDRKLQIVHGVLFAFLAYFIWKTQSRNALLVLIAFLVLAVVLFLRKKQTVAVGKGFCALMAVWPLLFAWLYMQLYGSSVVGRVLGFAVSEGKLLNSRTKMWNFAMQRYRTSPIVGAYNQITEGTGAGQMHNTHVDILAAYGPVVLVLVCVILYLLMRRSATNATHHPLYVVGFMCTIVMGMGEAAMFTGTREHFTEMQMSSKLQSFSRRTWPMALSTSASGVTPPYFCSSSRSSDFSLSSTNTCRVTSRRSVCSTSCCKAFSSLVMVTVMRLTAGSLVADTVRLSMLKPRRQNRLDTRARTPLWLSTSRLMTLR